MTGPGPVIESAECEAALQILDRGARALGLTLDERQMQSFATYCAVLRDVGRHTNLTGIRDPDGIMNRLFVDSLTILLAVPERTQSEPVIVVDVGAGAGIPGLPLKIACPAWHVILVESVGKKARFIEQVTQTLRLEEVTVLAERAEAAASGRFRDRADLCVSRAVASLPVLVELTAPFARPGGQLVFPKSGDIHAEIDAARRAMRLLHVALIDVIEVPRSLDLGGDHVLVVMEKRSRTPRAFPRRVGLARSRPIGKATPREPPGQRG